MSVQIYNTMTREKEKFEPIEPGKVRMYVCGPTVYDFLHVGNFVGAIFFNLVRCWLEKRDYEVTYVYNYTDVDDKIINSANKNNESIESLTTRITKYFHDDLGHLNCLIPNQEPKATENISEMITSIDRNLISANNVYDILVNGMEMKGFSKDSVNHEIDKAKAIKEEGRKKEVIFELEDHELIRGTLINFDLNIPLGQLKNRLHTFKEI